MEPVEPPNQVVTTKTEPAVLGPRTRILRTVLQVVAALAVSVPTLAKTFNMSAANTAKVTAAMGVITVIASIVHNAYDSKQAVPLGNDVGQVGIGLLLRIVALVCFLIVMAIGAGWITSAVIFAWLGAGAAAFVLASIL